MKKCVLATALAVMVSAAAHAERAPQPRSDADLVITGTVQKITTKDSTFGGDGVSTTYTAEVKVASVEKGKGAKEGEAVKVTWFRVTKGPSRPLPGAYGQSHDLKANDKARFWLMKGKGAWQIIYNRDGVEKLKGKAAP